MRRLEVTKFAAIIFLATVIAIVSARPQAAQAVGNYFHGLARPSVSDRDRFTADGWRAPIGQQAALF